MKAEKKFKPKYRERECQMCGNKHRPNRSWKIYCDDCYKDNEIEIRRIAQEKRGRKSKYWQFVADCGKMKPWDVVIECIVCKELFIIHEKKVTREHTCPKCKKLKRGAEYQEWVKTVLARDNYVCLECGSDEQIQAHHILSWRSFPDLRMDVTNGKTLCYKCHKKTINFAGRRPGILEELVESQKK